MRRSPTRRRQVVATEAWWMWLGKILRSMRSRPLAWLVAIWLTGWAFFAWHMVHPSSWETLWGILQKGITPQPAIQGQIGWLDELGRWGQIALYASTGALALYAGYTLWVWRKYVRDWMPAVREERLREGCVLEVLIPTGSKADARAAADLFGQLWNLLSNTARAGFAGNSLRTRTVGTGRARKMEAERLALSFEIWSTPRTEGKVGFYVWCPRTTGDGRGEGADGNGNSNGRLIEEVRHLIMVHYPRCRVRWVEDPLECALIDVMRASGASRISHEQLQVSESSIPTRVELAWCELGLLADSRYPIGSGGSDERLLTPNRTISRPGSPGAGSDPLAAVIGLLASDETVPIMGIQIVVAARPETVGQTQQAVNEELARLREMEMQLGKKALGPQYEARVLALEEKADRQGYDVLIRLVAAQRIKNGTNAGTPPGSMADARLTSLLRAYIQYNRIIAGVVQGFKVVRKANTVLHAEETHMSGPITSPVAVTSSTLAPDVDAVEGMGGVVEEPSWRKQLAPLLGRWPREGVCLPRMLPFMKIGKPCILNMAELSAIYHFPHQGLEGLSTLKWDTHRQIVLPAYAQVTADQEARGERVTLGVADEDRSQADPMPLDLARARHAPGRVQTVLPPGIRGVGTTPQDLRRGSYVFGPMGSGKSVFLYNIIAQYMATRRGVGILDGKGDSYEEVLRLVPPHLEGEVLAFDPENRPRGVGGAAGRSLGINPLDGRVVAQLGAEKVESLTLSLMRKMMGASWEQAVLMQRFLRDGTIAVLEAEPIPTMLNLWRWLQDDGKGGNSYREALVGKIRNQLVQDFWKNQVPSMSSQQRSSMQNVLTRVDRYVKNDVRYIILQPYSTVNFQELMDRGTIFVGRVSPRLGEDQSFLGALILNGFLTGAFARQSIPQEQRRDYLLVVDEFQNFVDTARADVERMLSMARGYRLGLMLAHQFTEQLPKEVLSAILKNVQTWVLFGLQADDARLFAGYMGLRAEDFQNLPPYHTYQRTVVNNTQTGVYSARPLPPPLPAANPGEPAGRGESRSAREGYREEEKAREAMRVVHAPEKIIALVRGEAEESEEACRARILTLSKELYWPAEEGDPVVVQALSLLGPHDLELYRRARRRVLDRQERERLLARPWLIADKAERIHRLSELRWGTPCVEIEALIRTALRGDDGADMPGGSGKPYGRTPGPKRPGGVQAQPEKAL